MNTRLQVEHAVTEAVTGLDLVEWQLRVAAAESLPLRQEEIPRRGHAIEVRLYAEDPERGFLPATGTLHGLRFPEGEEARVDTGVRQGDAVTPFYDPMLAKIIAFGEDREAARRLLHRALSETAVLGVATNLGFLARTVAEPDFAAGKLDTGFIERYREALLPQAKPAPEQALAAAALYRLLAQRQERSERRDPWAGADGWRLNTAPAPQPFVFRHGDTETTIAAAASAGGWSLRIGERCFEAAAEPGLHGRLAMTLDGTRSAPIVLADARSIAVFIGGERWQFEQLDPLAPPADAESGGGRLTAPMPGRVIELLVAPGASVRKGQPMMVVEAMKMEHTIAAPRDGVVAAVNFAAGDLVEEGAELVVLEEADAARG